MATKITRDIIESYLNCKYKGHLKLAGESGTQSDYETMTTATRQASREVAIAKLIARFGECDACREMAVTAATLKQGKTLLANAELADEDLVALLRCPEMGRRGLQGRGTTTTSPYSTTTRTRWAGSRRSFLPCTGWPSPACKGYGPPWG